MTRILQTSSIFLALALLATNLSAGIITGNGSGWNIPDNDPGGITSDIVITENETVTDVEVTLSGLTHSWAGDVTAKISNGTKTSSLVTRVGDPGGTSGDSSTYDGDYAFSSDGGDLWAAADQAGFGQAIPVGDYKPTGVANAPVSLSSVFSGESSAGTWTLFMSDSAQGDTGALVGWSIELTTSGGAGRSSSPVPEPGTMTVFAVGIGVACVFRRRRRPTRVGGDLRR
ncbi:MAG: proprotein convertase P-domain-containing protein [Rubripirellula sp.]